MMIPTSVHIIQGITGLLTNFVALKPGVPCRMHWTDHYWIEREIFDPELGRAKTVRSLVMWVDELDGEPAARTFSILSDKLKATLQPWLDGKKYLDYDFILTESGAGYYKEWNIQTILRTRT